jgi:glycosyltransferase involved in cell wall biosynthesis
MSLDPVMGGGTAERTLQLVRHMVSLGNECTILTTEIGMTPERRAYLKNCKIVALPVLSKRFFIPEMRRGDITKLVATTDIVHLMNHWTVFNALVYRAAHRLNKPYAVCPAGALPIFGRSRLLKKGYNALIGRNIIRQAQAHIAIASNEIDQFADYGITPDQITTIPNGVNPRDYQQGDVTRFRRQAGLGMDPYILFVGRLNLIKGPDLLLKAFFEISLLHRAAHLVFVGPDGGMEALLKGMTGEEGMRERVHFMGYMGGADKAAAYQGASFIVVPSRQEAMSIVALEAGICGKTVLMTDQCGFSTMGRTDGVQVVAPTVAGIRDGMLEMLQDNASTKEMGERFRQYVTENYTWDIAARRYQSLFEQVLRDGRA